MHELTSPPGCFVLKACRRGARAYKNRHQIQTLKHCPLARLRLSQLHLRIKHLEALSSVRHYRKAVATDTSHTLHRRVPYPMEVAQWEDGSAACSRHLRLVSGIPTITTMVLLYALLRPWPHHRHACFIADPLAAVQVVSHRLPPSVVNQARVPDLLQARNLRLGQLLPRLAGSTEYWTGPCNSLQTRIAMPTDVRMIYGCLGYGI